jgi:TatA/E family protein of Tat protein translocase
MFGIGMPELILILVVALIVIGPKKLPDLAKSLGKAMGEFKKATNDIKDSIQLDSGIKEVKTTLGDLEKELKKPIRQNGPDSSGGTASSDADSDTAGADTADAEVADAESADTEIVAADIEESASRTLPVESDADDSGTDAKRPPTS